MVLSELVIMVFLLCSSFCPLNTYLVHLYAICRFFYYKNDHVAQPQTQALTSELCICMLGCDTRGEMGAHSAQDGDPEGSWRQHQAAASESPSQTTSRDAQETA